jgi:hypothetical protein
VWLQQVGVLLLALQLLLRVVSTRQQGVQRVVISSDQQPAVVRMRQASPNPHATPLIHLCIAFLGASAAQLHA